MSTRLLVYIDEHWPAHPSAPWVLLDDRDRPTQQGQSEPQHWPASRQCEVVLSSSQSTVLSTLIPSKTRQDQNRLLRYALEDQLLNDVDEQHLTVIKRERVDDGSEVGVLVTARQRIRSIVAQFEALKRPLRRMVSELQALTPAADEWALCLGPTGLWTLHPTPQAALAVDPDTLADVFQHLLPARADASESPGALQVFGPATAHNAVRSAFTESAPALDARGDYAWWASSARATSLLHDEFAPRGGQHSGLAAIKAPLWLAACAGLVWLSVSLVDVLWHKRVLSDAEQRMVRMFETAVPNTPAIAPALQLRRTLDEARAQHGLLRENDFLTLLDNVADMGGAELRHAVTRLEYEDGVLRLYYDPARFTQAERLLARLNTLGHDAQADGQASSITLTRKTTP